jgi:hypothetical protein
MALASTVNQHNYMSMLVHVPMLLKLSCQYCIKLQVICEIWCSHSSDYDGYCLSSVMWCRSVWFITNSSKTFVFVPDDMISHATVLFTLTTMRTSHLMLPAIHFTTNLTLNLLQTHTLSTISNLLSKNYNKILVYRSCAGSHPPMLS